MVYASFFDDALAMSPGVRHPKVDAVTCFATAQELSDPRLPLWHVDGRKAAGLPTINTRPAILTGLT